VPLPRVLGTGRFNHVEAEKHPLWYRELHGFAEHRHEGGEFWWAAVLQDRWPQEEAWQRWHESVWDAVFGDRMQEMVFLGIGYDEAELRQRLDACLLTKTEAAALRVPGRRLEDPFPNWRKASET